MSTREWQSWILTTAIAAMALTIGAREIRARRELLGEPPSPPTFQADWRWALSAATLVSNPAAQVTLIEFVDLQCPFCRRSHAVVKELQKEYGARLAVAFVHFPLGNHPKARQRAFMVECGKYLGRGWAMIDQVFSLPSVELEDVHHVARQAGVEDSAAFSDCMRDSLSLGSVEIGRRAGDSLGVFATPTLILNGWRFKGAVPKEYLGEAIDDLLAGRKPRVSDGSPISAAEVK